MVAISSIIKEIVDNEGSLTVIRQEGYSILLEEWNSINVIVFSLKELDTIRNKMKEFIKEFNIFFGEVLASWTGDLTVFLPTKHLIKLCIE